MINSNVKQQIKSLVQSSQWEAIEQLAQELCGKIRERSVIDDTEWGTIQKILLIEGETQGITKFLQTIYEIASQ